MCHKNSFYSYSSLIICYNENVNYALGEKFMEVLSLGEKVKKRRKELNMTLKDVAGNRVTPGQISLVESSKSNPSMDLLDYLADTLDISVEYFMETFASKPPAQPTYNSP